MTDTDHRPLSVTQLSRYLKHLFEGDILLSNVWIQGEISNVRHYAAGQQIYFTLKDEDSQISCVIFASILSRLKFQPADSLKVHIRGRVTLYEKRGQYSLQVFYMEPQGVGALATAFEQLKEKLAKEGLFAVGRKKPMPLFPDKVAVIAAETGAAIQDILSISRRRCPLTEMVLFPAVVQGALASDSVADQLQKANADPSIEAVILARGGGSVEDLWAFNEEKLVRAMAASKIPVVSAIGHETDFTLADFVADLRAPTPSAAAELLIPDLCQILAGLETALNQAIQQKRQALLQHVIYLKERLELLNPATILNRGYSITRKNGKTLKQATEVSEGDSIETMLAGGRFISQVERITQARV